MLSSVLDSDGNVPSAEFVEMVDRLWLMRGLMTSLVDPENWLESGGEVNACVMIDSRAMVRAPARAHGQISSLFDAMDAAWKKGGAVAAEPEDDWEEIAKIHAKLQSTVLNMPEGPIRVETLIQTLGAMSGVPIVVDWASLASVRVLPELNVEIVAAELTAPQALDRYIARLVPDPLAGVSWTIHSGAVRIGAKSSIDVPGVVRVYNMLNLLPLAAALDKSSAGDETRSAALGSGDVSMEERTTLLRQLITWNVDPDGWIEGGGESGWLIYIGPLFVIKNSARNHFAIDDLLAKLRAGEVPAAPSPDDQ